VIRFEIVLDELILRNWSAWDAGIPAKGKANQLEVDRSSPVTTLAIYWTPIPVLLNGQSVTPGVGVEKHHGHGEESGADDAAKCSQRPVVPKTRVPGSMSQLNDELSGA
jgi:hypothetical protein